MLVFIWMCVMTSAFVPGGQGIVARQGVALEQQVLARYDSTPAPQASIAEILRQRAPGVRRATLTR